MFHFTQQKSFHPHGYSEAATVCGADQYSKQEKIVHWSPSIYLLGLFEYHFWTKIMRLVLWELRMGSLVFQLPWNSVNQRFCGIVPTSEAHHRGRRDSPSGGFLERWGNRPREAISTEISLCNMELFCQTIIENVIN